MLLTVWAFHGMELNKLVILFFAHWVGDFLFQTSSMAQLKGSSVKWLTIHVAVYTAVLFCFSLFLFDFQTAIFFVLLNAILHWLTDLITSRVSEKYRGNLRVFYPVIGFDQMVHYSTLLITSQFDYSAWL